MHNYMIIAVEGDEPVRRTTAARKDVIKILKHCFISILSHTVNKEEMEGNVAAMAHGIANSINDFMKDLDTGEVVELTHPNKDVRLLFKLESATDITPETETIH